MVVVVVEPRADTPLIGLPLVKKHLRVDHNDDDDLIELYQSAVEGWLDGPTGWLGRALGPQTLRATCLRAISDGSLSLPFPPATSIEGVTWTGADGGQQVVDPSFFELEANRVCLKPGAAWPPSSPLVVDFVAGYPAGELPRAIQAAILMMIGDLFAYRETSVVGMSSAEIKMTAAAEALLSPYRVWSV